MIGSASRQTFGCWETDITTQPPTDPYIDAMPDDGLADRPEGPLRRGWTTGACATAAAAAACELLFTGEAPAVATITLPNGSDVSFAVARADRNDTSATCGVIKDAGDDPDVTHGAMVLSRVWIGPPGSGVTFRAGAGVGTVTKPGLPIPPGEPAINPVPRAMITAAVTAVASAHSRPADLVVEVSIPGGDKLAEKTLNGRLGIVGGLSILGTTGIVVPYSCAAWIHSIHRGIDVARATGITHVAGTTGSTSEAAIQKMYGLADAALLDMGDFAGGMLKYLRRQPVPEVTIAGGFAKMTKLGQGLLDLHSKRGEIDRDWLATQLSALGANAAVIEHARAANTAQEILDRARQHGLPLGDRVADAAWETAAPLLADTDTALEIVVFDRHGQLAGRSGFRPAHDARPRNRR
jgi:cobalt-precorrin-5B (C1)-methyltransferase